MCGEESDKAATPSPRTGANGRGLAYARRMPREEFQHELDEIEALLQDAGRLCGRSLEMVLEALENADEPKAQQVIAGDDEVDSIYLKIEASIESLLARQAPVAVDLRLVLSMIHVNLHLERIGDQCVNIAKLIPLSGYEPPVRPEVLEAILKMGAHARSEIVQCKAAFTGRDVGLAEDLARQDREINRLNRQIFRLALEIGDDPDTREWAMHMILVARAIERIGDNAVDVGEQVAFVVTGLFREFSDQTNPLAG